jgi:5-formyltetrahydrofolate cyclo-ligase
MNGTKQAMRAAMTAARSRLSAGDRAAFSHLIAARVLGLAAVQRAHTLALYAPMGAEVDTAEIARELAARGRRIAYPRLIDGERALAFAACREDALRPGPLGTREPPPEATAVPAREIAAVLVPGLAFDGRGCRLGRGRGHYDATLASLPAATARIGLAFEMQIVPAVPHEEHDLPLDVVVTEAEVRFRDPGGAPRGDTSH